MNVYEYKNVRVYENYCGSFLVAHVLQILMKILKNTRKISGMIFSANIDRHKINPLIYVTYWKQFSLTSLLLGSEIFSLTPPLLTRLERCQRWFLKIIFHLIFLCHDQNLFECQTLRD